MSLPLAEPVAPRLPAWYPPAWIDRTPRAPADAEPALPKKSWPSLSVSRSRRVSPGIKLIKTHNRSQSDPTYSNSGPMTRQTRSSSSASSSSQSSSTNQLPKSILQRTSSSLTTRTAKSAKSVKFVDIPEVFYDDEFSDRSPSPVDDKAEDDRHNRKREWRMPLKLSRLSNPKQGKKRWRSGLQDSPLRPEISGPYRLYGGSCPALSSFECDKDGGSVRSFKSARSGRLKMDRAGLRSEISWLRGKLGKLWKGFFDR